MQVITLEDEPKRDNPEGVMPASPILGEKGDPNVTDAPSDAVPVTSDEYEYAEMSETNNDVVTDLLEKPNCIGHI